MSLMTPWELARWIRARDPDNRCRDEGWALVDLRAEAEPPPPVPGCLRVPEGADAAAWLAGRFAPEKSIVLYDAGGADRRAAWVGAALTERGFRRVHPLEGGPEAWRVADRRLQGPAPRELPGAQRSFRPSRGSGPPPKTLERWRGPR